MKDQIGGDTTAHDKHQVEIQFVAGATISITAGFVSWILRGGALLSSLLSSISLFKQFDPLAVVYTDPRAKNKLSENEQNSE